MKRDFKPWCLLLALGFSPAAALAIELPGSVDPGQVERRFDQQPTPAPGTGGALIPAITLTAPAAGAGGPILVKDIVLDGVTVYSKQVFRPLYEGKLGHEIPFGELQAVADQITLRYRTDGYILSQAIIPAQDVKDGILHIRVVEGFISRVVFDGNASDQVRRYADKIAEDRPLNIATLEHYVLLVNDLPGVHAESVLRPSPDTFGAAELVLKIERRAYDGSVGADNRGSKYAGPVEFSSMVAADSALGLDDRTQLRYATVNPAFEMRLFDVQETIPVSSTGTMLGLETSRTDTKPGFALETLQLNAISNDYELFLTYPVIRSRAENLTLQSTFDYRDTDTEVFWTTPFTDDRLRVLRVKATYSDADRLGGSNVADLQLSRGLNIFNASSNGTDRSRAFGVSDFSKMDADFSRTQALPYGFSVMTAVTGQYSADPLLVAEQLGLGGEQFASAYDPSEVLGDQGAAGRIELRHDEDGQAAWQMSFQPYVFYDLGAVWDKHEIGQQPHSLEDTGIGLRAVLPWNASAAAELALPMTKPPGTELNNNPHNPRFFFALGWMF